MCDIRTDVQLGTDSHLSLTHEFCTKLMPLCVYALLCCAVCARVRHKKNTEIHTRMWCVSEYFHGVIRCALRFGVTCVCEQAKAMGTTESEKEASQIHRHAHRV